MIHGWFTVAAQVVNFLILIWLFRRFLYAPILAAIDVREKRIQDQLALAEAKVADAQMERESFRRKSEEIDQQRDTLIATARDSAAEERSRLLETARRDADSLRQKRQEALRVEQQNLNGALVRWTQHEVFSIVRKTLQDLANVDLNNQIVDVLVGKLHELDDTSNSTLNSMFTSFDQTIHIRSAFDLNADQRTKIESALKGVVPPDAAFQFNTVPDLVSGIEVSCGGHRVAWSINDYLANLEQNAASLLNSEFNPGTSPK